MIDIYVLDTEFKTIGVIDRYESFIWTDRWNSYGDFELYLAFDIEILNICQQGYYLQIKQSEHTMIVEGIEVETDSETGVNLRITGRSLESLLDRRIIWQQTTLSAGLNFEAGIKKLITEQIGDPTTTPVKYPLPGVVNNQGELIKNADLSRARMIENFIFLDLDQNVEPDAYNYIHGILLEKVQYTGDNLYDVLLNMCEEANNTIGWKITHKEVEENGEISNWFVFHLMTGKDYSYQQTGYVKTMDTEFISGKTYYTYDSETKIYTPVPAGSTKQKNVDYYEEEPIRPYVIFSPNFDNIINTNYLDSTEEMKNVTLVAGSGEGNARKTLIVGSAEGLERRELFTDARDLTSGSYSGSYNDALKTRGMNKLYENSRIQSYEGQVEATRQFVYGEDFKMGDIVQMSNEYGINGAVRVIEWIISESSTGIELYPTFDAVQLIDDTEHEEEE